MDLMPVGMSGRNSKKLNEIIMIFQNSGVQSSIIFSSLQSINMSSGGNLRRIGSNIGFKYDDNNDETYRRALLGFISLKENIGSVGAFYIGLGLFGLNIDQIDIYNYFGAVSGLTFLGNWKLDARRVMNATSDTPDFSTFIDFHRENGSVFPGGESIMQFCRPPGRLVISREVLELNPKNSNTDFGGNLLLDASWTLDESKRLDPYRDGSVCRLLINGQIVEESNLSTPSKRLTGKEWAMATEQLFNQVQIWDLNEKLAELTFVDPIRFTFTRKTVVWRYNELNAKNS